MVDQLAVVGRMVIPVGTNEQEMDVVTLTPTRAVEKQTLYVGFVPITRKPVAN